MGGEPNRIYADDPTSELYCLDNYTLSNWHIYIVEMFVRHTAGHMCSSFFLLL